MSTAIVYLEDFAINGPIALVEYAYTAPIYVAEESIVAELSPARLSGISSMTCFNQVTKEPDALTSGCDWYKAAARRDSSSCRIPASTCGKRFACCMGLRLQSTFKLLQRHGRWR